MATKPVTLLINALTARTRFGEIMAKAENEQARFVVSRRGKATVVIMSVEDYLHSVLKTPGRSDSFLRSGSWHPEQPPLQGCKTLPPAPED